MTIFPVFILAVVVAALVYFMRKGPTPEKRTILYGYFGCTGEQVAEVAGHTNMHWEAFWDSDVKAIQNTLDAEKFTALDVSRIFERTSPTQMILRPQAEDILRDLFDGFRAMGALRYVKMIVPIDEPNLPENQACEYLPRAVGAIRTVAAEYKELDGLILGCIYYNYKDKCHTDLFDAVGFDDYEPGAGILSPGGAYERFRDTLKPGQRTMLIPGGGHGPARWEPKQQDPAPFVQYAKANREVMMVVPFLWRYPPHGGDIVGIVDLPDMRAAYTAAGKTLMETA